MTNRRQETRNNKVPIVIRAILLILAFLLILVSCVPPGYPFVFRVEDVRLTSCFDGELMDVVEYGAEICIEWTEVGRQPDHTLTLTIYRRLEASSSQFTFTYDVPVSDSTNELRIRKSVRPPIILEAGEYVIEFVLNGKPYEESIYYFDVRMRELIIVTGGPCVVAAGNTMPLSVTGMPGADAYSWTASSGNVNPPDSSAAVYTAPNTPGDVIIRVEAEEDGVTLDATITCKVTGPTPTPTPLSFPPVFRVEDAWLTSCENDEPIDLVGYGDEVCIRWTEVERQSDHTLTLRIYRHLEASDPLFTYNDPVSNLTNEIRTRKSIMPPTILESGRYVIEFILNGKPDKENIYEFEVRWLWACTSYRPVKLQSADIPGEVTIDSPPQGTTDLPSRGNVQVAGTYTGIPKGYYLWVFIYSSDAGSYGRYYPQTRDAVQGWQPDPTTGPNGRWSFNVSFGAPSLCYEVIIMVADATASKSIADQLKRWAALNNYSGYELNGPLTAVPPDVPGFPTGLVEKASIEVKTR